MEQEQHSESTSGWAGLAALAASNLATLACDNPCTSSTLPSPSAVSLLAVVGRVGSRALEMFTMAAPTAFTPRASTTEPHSISLHREFTTTAAWLRPRLTMSCIWCT